jgi:hypothetical protein
MEECKCKKRIWWILGLIGLVVLIAPLVYAVVKVDKIPGLIIRKDKEPKE